jgi:hypothetical protein
MVSAWSNQVPPIWRGCHIVCSSDLKAINCKSHLYVYIPIIHGKSIFFGSNTVSPQNIPSSDFLRYLPVWHFHLFLTSFNNCPVEKQPSILSIFGQLARQSKQKRILFPVPGGVTYSSFLDSWHNCCHKIWKVDNLLLGSKTSHGPQVILIGVFEDGLTTELLLGLYDQARNQISLSIPLMNALHIVNLCTITDP